MTNAFTCIIIDDEEHAIGLLTESLNDLYGNITVMASYTAWKDGLEAIRTTTADIVFLDISIGGKNGLEMLKLSPHLDCEIIFVTAYAEYALEAFKHSATGYLVKPIGDTQLSNAVNRALEHIRNKRLARQPSVPVSTKIGIPHGNGINYYEKNDIIYLEADGNYTRVVTKSGDVLSSYNIGKYRDIFDELPFYSVHRSYIVNLNFVSRYEAVGAIIMANKKEIPVSKSAKDGFLKLLGGPHFRSH